MERKLATVLFVDLVGSTQLVASADPEVVRSRLSRFFDLVAPCITAHGGLVEKFAGDAVMAAFGVPLAHEDDPERAVRAALAIVEAVVDLGLEVRIGIESGEIVADEAEQLLREADDILRPTGFRRHRIEPLEALAALLRNRGRTSEAEAVEDELAALHAAPAASR